jgi:hypothetical protein
MAKKERPRLCIDRVIPYHLKVGAAALAVSENPKNEPKLLPGRGVMLGVSVHPVKIALVTGKSWKEKGRTLRVKFLDGSTVQKERVQGHAIKWSDVVNIKFDFVTTGTAEIRISFEADDGSWSAIGTDCLDAFFPASGPTMNYGWLKDDTDDVEYRRVVTHEFGHALGAIHEHQNPKAGITWNEAKVLAAFRGPPNNWSDDEIRSNILDKYSLAQLNGTKFDPKSIMLYTFPSDFAIPPREFPNNTTLSSGDKKFMKKFYPK